MTNLLKRTSLLTIGGLMTSALFAQEVPKGWHMQDPKANGYYGISIDKAYEFVKSKNLKSNTVIVAVIDSGIDTTHEDLKPVLWVNKKEIPGNGIDDDKNGYIDDINGWNFLGSRDGKQNVEKDSYEVARVYHLFKTKYEGKIINQPKEATQSFTNSIKLKKKNGIYLIPCKVNKIPLDFVFDGGASTVSISLTEAQFMFKNGYLTADDIIGSSKFKDATGSISTGTRINLKELIVGDIKLTNIEASVVHNLDAPLLLGQSAMEKFGKYSFDYSNNILTIGEQHTQKSNSNTQTFNESEYAMWLRAKEEVAGGDSKTSSMELVFLKRAYNSATKADSILRKAMGKEKYTGKELEAFTSDDADVKKAKNMIYGLMSGNDALESNNEEFVGGFGDYVESEMKKAEAAETAPENYRGNIVKDNYNDFNDKFYGNNNVFVNNKSALHGTHVSGIIAAARGNGKGMDGVADNVRIMSLRAVPDGDEHDKDIALAIRYAADNGAQVINMSFGKGFSPEKQWVDDAVKYAESKGVLLVHAAGNDAKNIDTSFNYPTPVFNDGKRAGNWITVGASGPNNENGNSLTANFSNYGKQEVDVFAPGVKIYATVPGGNTYQNLQGTSMASPVVAGLAALILQYYPALSPQQVKMVIEKSAQKPALKVKNPGTGEEVNLSDISRSGGVINAYEALKLASTLKGERNKNIKAVKSTVKPKRKG